MDKRNLHPGEEPSDSSSGDDQGPGSVPGDDQASDSAIERMTTDEPVEPKSG